MEDRAGARISSPDGYQALRRSPTFETTICSPTRTERVASGGQACQVCEQVMTAGSEFLDFELSEALLKALFDSAVDAIVVIERNGTVRLFNPAASRLFGYAQEEVVGRNVALLMRAEDGQSHDSYLHRYAATGERSVIGIGRNVVARRKDGSHVPVHLSVGEARLRSESYYVGVMHDISAIQEAEATRSKLIEELSFKNAELERFTYTVSHDLKSPLITIKGFAGMLQDAHDAGDYSTFSSDLQRVTAAADKMTRLLDEVLALSRVGRVVNPTEDIDLHALALSVVESLAGPLTQRGVRVIVEEPMPMLRGDRVRLFEVLQNLIENAAKFMGGQRRPEVKVSAVQDGDCVRLSVVDNGIGLTEAYKDRIFALFEQLDPTHPGTGVGLALVKRIVEAHGGKVWVESPGDGLGASFFVLLPAAGGRN